MKVISSKTLYSTPYLNLDSATFATKYDRMGYWIYASRPNGMKAVMINAMVGDKLLVIKEYRCSIQDYEWGAPAGLINEGDDIKEAARRELKEETGLDIVCFVRPPSPFVYNSPGLTNESISICDVIAEGTLSNEGNEGLEEIESFLMSRDEVNLLMDNARRGIVKVGAKSWLTFTRFVEEGKI